MEISHISKNCISHALLGFQNDLVVPRFFQVFNIFVVYNHMFIELFF